MVDEAPGVLSEIIKDINSEFQALLFVKSHIIDCFLIRVRQTILAFPLVAWFGICDYASTHIHVLRGN